MSQKLNAALLGASGYTGADLMRLGALHPNIQFTVLTANTHAGKPVDEVFPHLGGVDLPQLQRAEGVAWSVLDVVFCGLPHATSQQIVSEIVKLTDKPKIIDMSADFRLRDPEHYKTWYGNAHVDPTLQNIAAYGLTEHNRQAIREKRIIACPGCYPTAVLLALLPLAKAQLINVDALIVDAKSGVTGAGRGLKQNTLAAEAGESISPYAVGAHRHTAELEQEIGAVAGKTIKVNFTPHLIPMSRGELITAHVELEKWKSVNDLRAALESTYEDEPFVRVLAQGKMPSTGMVRGSNTCVINVFEDRIPGRAVVIAALDNLVKGSAGQAVQNFNVAFGLEETTGLSQLPMFP